MKIQGQARIKLLEADGVVSTDTGWVSNVVTDVALLGIADANNLASLDIFIHESSAPGRANRTALPFTYTSQVPAQVSNPDTTVVDEATALSTFTVQFSPPTVTRNINIVGLTLTTAISNFFVNGIVAYTSLTTTVVQGTSQTADVQYRLTWSFA